MCYLCAVNIAIGTLIEERIPLIGGVLRELRSEGYGDTERATLTLSARSIETKSIKHLYSYGKA